MLQGALINTVLLSVTQLTALAHAGPNIMQVSMALATLL
jgi:hypothetical protein